MPNSRAKRRAYEDAVEITKAALQGSTVHVMKPEFNDYVAQFFQVTYDKLSEIAISTGEFD